MNLGLVGWHGRPGGILRSMANNEKVAWNRIG